MSHTVRFELSDADIEYFEGIAASTIPAHQGGLEAKVRQKLAEIQGMLAHVPYAPDFVTTFVADMKTLYDMLCDDGYDLSDQTKPWILYALGYVVETVDAVPDPVPLVGFLDDVIVVAWICDKLKGEMKIYRDLRG